MLYAQPDDMLSNIDVTRVGSSRSAGSSSTALLESSKPTSKAPSKRAISQVSTQWLIKLCMDGQAYATYPFKGFEVPMRVLDNSR